MASGGRFETRVYHIEATGQFHIIDYRARATPHSWVVVRRLTAGKNVIQRFRGQPYIGVVRMLEPYQLKHSEQQKPRLLRACPD